MNGTGKYTGSVTSGNRRTLWLRITVILAATVLIVVAAMLMEPAGKIGSEWHGKNLPEDPAPDMPVYMPPIVEPDTFPIEEAIKEADLKDDTIMIAVQVGDHHRAYLLTDLFQIGAHVVNDLIDGVPISITHCNQTDCTRVFTDPHSDQPLKLLTAAWMNHKMILGVGAEQKLYEHDDPTIPLAEHKFQLIAFGKWCELHPEGSVYIGNVAWEMPEDLAP